MRAGAGVEVEQSPARPFAECRRVVPTLLLRRINRQAVAPQRSIISWQMPRTVISAPAHMSSSTSTMPPDARPPKIRITFHQATDTPLRAAATAAENPAGPPPTTTTSACEAIGTLPGLPVNESVIGYSFELAHPATPASPAITTRSISRIVRKNTTEKHDPQNTVA